MGGRDETDGFLLLEAVFGATAGLILDARMSLFWSASEGVRGRALASFAIPAGVFASLLIGTAAF
jgi:hypothetical protein